MSGLQTRRTSASTLRAPDAHRAQPDVARCSPVNTHYYSGVRAHTHTFHFFTLYYQHQPLFLIVSPLVNERGASPDSCHSQENMENAHIIKKAQTRITNSAVKTLIHNLSAQVSLN